MSILKLHGHGRHYVAAATGQGASLEQVDPSLCVKSVEFPSNMECCGSTTSEKLEINLFLWNMVEPTVKEEAKDERPPVIISALSALGISVLQSSCQQPLAVFVYIHVWGKKREKQVAGWALSPCGEERVCLSHVSCEGLILPPRRRSMEIFVLRGFVHAKQHTVHTLIIKTRPPPWWEDSEASKLPLKSTIWICFGVIKCKQPPLVI